MKFKLIENISTASREEINAFSSHNLKLTLNAIYKSSGYSSLIPEIKRIKSLSDIPILPYMDSNFISEYSPPEKFDLVCNSKNSGVVLATGGTTGKKKTFYHSWDSFRSVMNVGSRSIKSQRFSQPMKVANCFLPGSLWGGFLFGQGVIEVLSAQLFALGRPSLDELFQVIYDHKINVLFASPSYATNVFMNTEIDLMPLNSITHYYYVGEAVSDSLNRHLVENYPKLSIKSLAYTTNETGPIGYQCEFQSGGYHHINEDCVFVEIIDSDTGEVLQDGEGEIVVSTIANDGMPVFRYRLGDKGRIVSHECKCGTNLKTLLLSGRVGNSRNICGVLVSDRNFLDIVPGVKSEDLQVSIFINGGKTGFILYIEENVFKSVDAKKIKELIKKHSVLKGVVSEAQFFGFEIKSIPRSQFFTSDRTGKKLFFIEGRKSF